jgi:hypothetical protein
MVETPFIVAAAAKVTENWYAKDRCANDYYAASCGERYSMLQTLIQNYNA